jgi:FlaG/FlaF family flagellin (archaellin)
MTRFKKNYGVLLVAGTLLLAACSGSTVKEGINKAGDVAGQAAGEFVEGAAHGVEKSFELNPVIDPQLQAKGISLGSYSVTSDSAATDNILTLYVIFGEAYQGSLTAKVYDHKQLEMGRATANVTGTKGEAKYVEFRFDPHANIDSDTKVTLE